MTEQYTQTNINITKETFVFVTGPVTLSSSVGAVWAQKAEVIYAITLPSAGAAPGQAIDFGFISSVGASSIQIVAQPGETIDGAGLYTVPAGLGRDALRIRSMPNTNNLGFQWVIISVN